MTLGSEKTLSSLWQMKKYTSICSKEELWAVVVEEEAKTPLEQEVHGGVIQGGAAMTEILGQATLRHGD